MTPVNVPKWACGYWVNPDGTITWRLRVKRSALTGRFRP